MPRFIFTCLVLALAVGSADATCRQRIVHQANVVQAVVPVVPAAVIAVPAYGAAYDPGDGGNTKEINDRLDRLEKLLQQFIDKQPVPPAQQPKAAATSKESTAKEEYLAFLKYNSCLQCHGNNGTSKGGLVLARNGVPTKLTADQRESLVVHSYFGTMPPKKFLDDNKLKPPSDEDHGKVMAAIKEGILR